MISFFIIAHNGCIASEKNIYIHFHIRSQRNEANASIVSQVSCRRNVKVLKGVLFEGFLKVFVKKFQVDSSHFYSIF